MADVTQMQASDGKMYNYADASARARITALEQGGASAKVVLCTLGEYHAMETHDKDTYYLITDITDYDEDREV